MRRSPQQETTTVEEACVAARPQRFKERAASSKRRRRQSAETWNEDCAWPPIGSIGRTNRLLMAALRVWELKHGIRDQRWNGFERAELSWATYE